MGPRIVGLTFVWSGGIKATSPHTFEQHLYSLGWIPQNFVRSAVTASAAAEVALGTGLLLAAAPAVLYPLTLAGLVVLSFISWWGVRSGKANDCGCYGGFIQPSIEQSLGLNALFAVLILTGWLGSRGDVSFPIWKALTVAAAFLVVAIFTDVAQRHARKTGKPLLDLNPLKVGKRWRHSWTHGLTAKIDGEVLVAFLGPDCPYCGDFVKVGNAMTQSPKLPNVVGVVATSKDRLATFISEKGIRFPTVNVSQSLMSRLVNAVPTVALVDDSQIKRVWIGNVPPDVVDRFKGAFFPMLEAAPTSALGSKS
jgi:hypothetical protein